MAPLVPPPSSPPRPQPEGNGPSVGGILFGLGFIVIAAIIFTLALEPQLKQVALHPVTPMPTLPLTYPPSRTVDESDTYFGVKVADPYRWLEDGKSPEVQAWLDCAESSRAQLSRCAARPRRR